MRLYPKYAIKALDISYDKLAKSKTEHNNETYSKGNVMFSLNWESDYRRYEATYDDGWQRLNYCNAAIYSQVTYDECTYETHNIHEWYLNSYVSPIMMVRRIHNVSDGVVTSLTFAINEEQWRCSNTTIKHVSRFLKMLDHYHHIGVTYHDLKYWSNKSTDYYWHPMPVNAYDIEASILFQTRREMLALFKRECPVWSY